MWRLVFEQVATLEEVERFWNYDDIKRGNAILDYRQISEYCAHEDAMRDAKRKQTR